MTVTFFFLPSSICIRYSAVTPPPIIMIFFAGFLTIPSALRFFIRSSVPDTTLILSPVSSLNDPSGTQSFPSLSTVVMTILTSRSLLTSLSILPSSGDPATTFSEIICMRSAKTPSGLTAPGSPMQDITSFAMSYLGLKI